MRTTNSRETSRPDCGSALEQCRPPFCMLRRRSLSNAHASPSSMAQRHNNVRSSNALPIPQEIHASPHRRFPAGPGRGGGDIRPIGLDEPAPLEAEPRHFLAQRAPRNVEPLHDGADLAARLLETALDHGALERLDLLGERELPGLRP